MLYKYSRFGACEKTCYMAQACASMCLNEISFTDGYRKPFLKSGYSVIMNIIYNDSILSL